MIKSDHQLKRTREALHDLEESMAALNRKRDQIHPDRFALMAEPIIEHIRQLRAEIDVYTGVSEAIAAEAPLWLSLRGPNLELDNAPSSIITAMVDILRVGVQSIAEFLMRGVIGQRPTVHLREACDFQWVGLVPGSVCIGLRLPEFPQNALYREMGDAHQHARKALDLYLRAAAWTGSTEDITELERLVPDSTQRLLILNQVARLIPRPRGALEVVQLSGRAVSQGKVELRREARTRISKAVESTLREQTERAKGVLREIDLDQRTFTIRSFEATQEVRCKIDEEDEGLLEIAKAALDYQVEVVGTRTIDSSKRRSVPLQVREIEIIGRETEEENSENEPEGMHRSFHD